METGGEAARQRQGRSLPLHVTGYVGHALCKSTYVREACAAQLGDVEQPMRRKITHCVTATTATDFSATGAIAAGVAQWTQTCYFRGSAAQQYNLEVCQSAYGQVQYR